MAGRRPFRKCSECDQPCRPDVSTKIALCRPCKLAKRHPEISKPIIESATAPRIPGRPDYSGNFIICADLHVPYHKPEPLIFMCAVARELGIKNLIIAGDLTHYDTLSNFRKISRTPSVSEEVMRTVQVLGGLQQAFPGKIIVGPGNHDHRVEKSLSTMGRSLAGQKALEMLDAALGGTGDICPADMAISFFQHFFSSKGVEVLQLSDLTINKTWLIQHPKTASRLPPHGERRVAHTERMCVIQGHSHTGTAFGFDDSGTDMVVHIGPMSDDDKFRYKRERPSHYPKPVPGFVIILDNEAWPVAIHPRAANVLDLIKRIRG